MQANILDEKKLFIPVTKIQIMEDCRLDGLDIAGRFNPRGLENLGFDGDRMETLRTSIRDEGLDTPLLVRQIDGGYYLLAGERRLRSIKHLCDENVVCYNPLTRRNQPAREIYIDHGVEVKVKVCKSEIEYLRISIGENVLHEPLTDFDLLVQLDRMEQAGVSRAAQAETMRKSEAWVSQSHSILGSHPKIVELMKQGRLSRTAAITFISVPKDKIEAVLSKAIDLTYSRAEDKVAEGIAERESALDDLEEASTTLSIAQFVGDTDCLRRARRTASDAGRRMQRADRKITSGRSDDTITDATILTAARDVKGAGQNIRRPRPMREVREKMEGMQKLAEEAEDGYVEYKGMSVPLQRVHDRIRALNWVLNAHDSGDPLDDI